MIYHMNNLMLHRIITYKSALMGAHCVCEYCSGAISYEGVGESGYACVRVLCYLL